MFYFYCFGAVVCIKHDLLFTLLYFFLIFIVLTFVYTLLLLVFVNHFLSIVRQVGQQSISLSLPQRRFCRNAIQDGRAGAMRMNMLQHTVCVYVYTNVCDRQALVNTSATANVGVQLRCKTPTAISLAGGGTCEATPFRNLKCTNIFYLFL